MKTDKEKALEIAQLMEDGKGKDVVVLDVSQLNSWTDFFVIVTVNSSVHWKGLYKIVKTFVNSAKYSSVAMTLKITTAAGYRFFGCQYLSFTL